MNDEQFFPAEDENLKWAERFDDTPSPIDDDFLFLLWEERIITDF